MSAAPGSAASGLARSRSGSAPPSAITHCFRCYALPPPVAVLIGRLQRLHDAQRARAAGEGLGSGPDALDEVLRRQGERLGRGWHLERAAGESADRHDRRRAPPGRRAQIEGEVVESEPALLEAPLVRQHAVAADDDDLRRLLRMQPAEMDVRRHAALELDVAERDVGDPRLEMRVPVQADRRQRTRHQVEQDREVVRRRVPPHVRIAPDASHAEPLEGEVQHRPEGAALDEALHLPHERVVEEGLVDEQDATRVARGVDQLASVRGGQRERLLHPDVLAGTERGERHGMVV